MEAYIYDAVRSVRGKGNKKGALYGVTPTELSKQVEQVKLQVSKDTTVFSTIKEAVIPIKRTSPKRTQLVIIFGFIGLVISTGFILTKDILFDVFNEVKS